jgi:ATP-dependent Zn protease
MFPLCRIATTMKKAKKNSAAKIEDWHEEGRQAKTAIHEVGHVLMKLLCGSKFTSVTIIKSGKHDGITRHENSGILPQNAEDHICIYLGGLTFELMVYGDDSSAYYADDSDQAIMEVILSAFFPDLELDDPAVHGAQADLREIYRTLNWPGFFSDDEDEKLLMINKVRRRSERLFRRNYSAGILLAKELMQRKSMTYEDVIAFLQLKAGEADVRHHKQSEIKEQDNEPDKSGIASSYEKIKFRKDARAISALKGIAKQKIDITDELVYLRDCAMYYSG